MPFSCSSTVLVCLHDTSPPRLITSLFYQFKIIRISISRFRRNLYFFFGSLCDDVRIDIDPFLITVYEWMTITELSSTRFFRGIVSIIKNVCCVNYRSNYTMQVTTLAVFWQRRLVDFNETGFTFVLSDQSLWMNDVVWSTKHHTANQRVKLLTVKLLQEWC